MKTAQKTAAHACHCRTTKRSAAVMISGQERDFDDFRSVVVHYGGSFDAELSVVTFPIGNPQGFGSLRQMCDFLLEQWGREAGRLRCCWLEPAKELHEQLSALVAARPLSDWVSESVTPLKEILEARRIETWFQPIFSGDALSLWGYECLARARDRDGRLISPTDLFSWARKENLVFMLDRVCREKHIESSATAPVPSHVHFLINFLPTVIYDPTVCLSNTFGTSRKVGLDPHRVIFEVVETERVSDREHLRRILDEYRKAGFRVALDDVGAGHSSLTLLADLSPDLIKIDRALVSSAGHSALHTAVCRSIVEVGRVTGKLVLAEGVETQQEYELFRSMGVDLFQGYLFGKPQAEPRQTSEFAMSSVA